MIASLYTPGLVLGAAAAAQGMSLPLGYGAFQPQSRAAVWQPKVGATWQIVLRTSLNIDVQNPAVVPARAEIFDIDLFTNTDGGKDAAKIAALHGLGKKVICYFSAGTWEEGRPDSDRFTDADKGNRMDDWPENWIDITSANVRKIMAARIATAADMGCDAVDPDNLDGYDNAPVNNEGTPNEFTLTTKKTIDYVKWMAGEASKRGMAIGLKNAGKIVGDVLSVVQFGVNEQCVAYKECSTFLGFIEAGKPVFHIEYPNGDDMENQTPVKDTTRWCKSSPEWTGKPNADISKMSTVIKDMALDGWVEYCDNKEFQTALDE